MFNTNFSSILSSLLSSLHLTQVPDEVSQSSVTSYIFIPL